MFVILVPVCIAPALVVLFWADRKARRTGALSLASSSYARKQVLKKEGALQKTVWEQVVYYWHRVDVIGLVLLGFSFGLILVPVTLSASMEGGYANSTSLFLHPKADLLHTKAGGVDSGTGATWGKLTECRIHHCHVRNRCRPLVRLYRLRVEVCQVPHHAQARLEQVSDLLLRYRLCTSLSPYLPTSN